MDSTLKGMHENHQMHIGGVPNICSRPESGLRSSIRASLTDLIKKKRDEAFQLESLLRELPNMSHEADRAIWDMICGNAAGFR